MTVHIISNPERTVRVERCHKEMKRQGITDYQLWPSIHVASKPARTGISRAHKQIVEWAANSGLEEVCIMEDDVWFPAEDGFRYFLNNKPNEYDQYLGGLSRGDVDANKITKRYSGQFCYFIHEKYYDRFLRTDENLDIDGGQSNRGVFKVCYPFAAFCYPGWSDNCNGPMNHHHLLMGQEIYGYGLIKNSDDVKALTELANKTASL